MVVPTVLLYGTGGLAYGNVQVTDTVFSSNFGAASFSSSDTRVGWTVGFGIEGLFINAPQWTWRVEYLYLDLGTVNGSGIDPNGQPVVWNASSHRQYRSRRHQLQIWPLIKSNSKTPGNVPGF